MAIRLSGMVSGMDTETLVSALVSSYSLKKNNLVKAQTKMGWTKDKWKTMNTSIYSFYSGKLSSARFSSSYNLKTSSVSNPSAAKVTAASGAVSGTQTLKVKELASTGYLTGGEIKGEGDTKLKGSSKLSDVKGLSDLTNGSISVTSNGKTTDIKITSDMTLSQFAGKLKDAGLNANFDDKNGRFFISSKTSGKDYDFSLTANDAEGLKALNNLGINASSDAATAEYSKWANYSEDEINALKQKAYDAKAVNADARAKQYVDKYKAAKKAIDTMQGNDTWGKDEDGNPIGLDELKNRNQTLVNNLDNDFSQYRKFKAEVDEDGNVKKDAEGNVIYTDEYETTADGRYVYDTSKMSEDEKKSYNDQMKAIKNSDSSIKSFEDNQKVIDELSKYVNTDTDADGKVTYSANMDEVNATVDEENAKIKADSDAAIDAKVAYSKEMNAKVEAGESLATGASANAVRINGQDSEIYLNGAKFVSNTNTFAVNGLTIQATAKTGDEEVTITTDTDVDGIYDMVKGFLKEYNDLIKSMDVAYNAASAKGYDPLTSEEKDAMSDDEVEKWENKIKDSLLRKDGTLGGIMNSMKTDMLSSFNIDGKSYSLSSFGISTLGYFASPENETGVFHIDGDKDDTATSGNADKLRSMIANDPDTVISFFSKLADKVYQDLGKKMASSSTSSAYTVYNDKQMNIQYSEYNTKINSAEDLVTRWEDYYFKKFSSMESMLSSINAQSSSLGNMFGGM